MSGLTEAVKLRAARPDEAEALSGLTMRSKAYWGYDEEFLAACRNDLWLRRSEVVAPDLDHTLREDRHWS